MKNYTKILFLLVVMLSCFVGNEGVAQVLKSRKADFLYENGAWNIAIPKLRRAYNKEPNVAIAGKIGDSYLRYNQFDSACVWYAKMLPDFGGDSLSMRNYAMALLASGNYGKAKSLLKEYNRRFALSGPIKMLMKSCDSPSQLPNYSATVAINAEANNSKNNDFSPIWYKGSLYYCSSRRSTGSVFDGDGKPFIRIFKGEEGLEKDFIVDSKLLKVKKASRFHLGPFSFFPDSSGKILITGNTSPVNEAGKYTARMALLKLFYAEKTKNGFKITSEFEFNEEKYSTGHPSVSPNGKHLLFVSDRVGTLGGTDILYCKRDGDKWSQPINMGPSVNTFGNEMFPTFVNDTLVYFSSNGLAGFGGLDLFKARFKEGKLDKIENAGRPYNSSKDDFSISFKAADEGFLSSNRDGGSGQDDIYYFRGSSAKVNLIVMNGTRNVPIEKALVRVNSTVYPVDDRLTDSVGHTDLTVISTSHIDVTAIKPNFRPGRARFLLDSRRTRDTTLYVYLYEGNSCTISGIVRDEKGSPVEGAKVVLNDTVNLVTENTFTKPDGSYMFVVDPGASVRVNVSGEGYFANSNFAGLTNTLGGCNKVIDFTMNYMLADRTLALENIYYDFDKWYIRDEALLILEKVRKIMTDNPTMMIEVSSHTDMRGTSRYNDELSVRRAEVVMEYLVRKGISPERLTYKVYGKVRPAIPCPNESDCNEAKHQLNRRTEFKVLYF